MILQKENPGWESEVPKNCACGGRCKQIDIGNPTPKSQPIRLSESTRISLALLRHKLTKTGDNGLTTMSSISAIDFLLGGY